MKQGTLCSDTDDTSSSGSESYIKLPKNTKPSEKKLKSQQQLKMFSESH